MDNKEDEYQRIEAEVKKRKERARQLGVDKFMGELFNDLKYYPTWFQKNRAYTPLITDARELEKEIRGSNEWRRWQITLKGNDYIFAFREYSFYTPDGEYGCNGDFEIYKDGKKVLAIDISQHTDQYSDIPQWSAFDIDGFIEGEWIGDFKELYEASKKAHEDGLKKLFKKPADKLKEDFGIE